MSPARLKILAHPTGGGHQSADPDVVERAAKNWSDAVLECRTYNHKWAPQRATWNSEYRFYHIVQICLSCRSERTMDMDDRGEREVTHKRRFAQSSYERLRGPADKETEMK